LGPGAEIGDGVTNTNAILNDCPSAPAASAARSLGPEWFLPSTNELKEMAINRTTLEAATGFDAFSDDYRYWSSTEGVSGAAWSQFFGSVNQHDNYKTCTGYVRAVRAF
jgi:hypothetical protein